MTTTTDTPRTNAASFSSRDPLELMQTSQKLERELLAARDDNFNLANSLSKAEAEVERLREWIRSEWPADQAEEIINNCKSK